MTDFDCCSKKHDAFFQIEAEIDKLEASDKADYLQASQRVPHLLLSESNPERFLKFANWNVAAAAQGLVTYWKRRREVFGESSFILPLSFAGGEYSALSEAAIDHIKTGTGTFLPNDAEGCTVLCFDPSRRVSLCPDVRLQTTFYYGQLLSEGAKSQSDGYVILILMSRFNFDPTSSANVRTIMSCFPMKPKAWHFVNCLPKWNNGCLVRSFVNGILALLGKFARNQPHHVYTSHALKSVRYELESKHGLVELPALLGGRWNYEAFALWMAERQRLDLARYPTFREVEQQQQHGPPDKRKGETASMDNNIKLIQFDLLKKQCLEWLQGMLQDLPPTESAAYRQARNSSLWQSESLLEAFLQRDDFHTWLAAKRIASYWQLRREWFGNSTLPMHQTGEGALGRSELQMLRTRFLMLLPADSEGSPVVWIDPLRLRDLTNADATSCNRCLFYTLFLAAGNKAAQRQGIVLLLRYSDDFEYLSNLERLAHCLPIRIKAIHILSYQPVPANSQFDFGDQTLVHVCSSQDEFASRLLAYGISKAGLPSSINGGWTYSKFVLWQELKIRMEFRVPQGLSGRSDELTLFPAIGSYEVLPDDEKEERARRLNLVHSRRKRARVRIEKDSLQEERAELTQEKERLQRENGRLATLLQNAYEVVKNAGKSRSSVSAVSSEDSPDPLVTAAAHDLLDLVGKNNQL